MQIVRFLCVSGRRRRAMAKGEEATRRCGVAVPFRCARRAVPSFATRKRHQALIGPSSTNPTLVPAVAPDYHPEYIPDLLTLNEIAAGLPPRLNTSTRRSMCWLMSARERRCGRLDQHQRTGHSYFLLLLALVLLPILASIPVRTQLYYQRVCVRLTSWCVLQLPASLESTTQYRIRRNYLGFRFSKEHRRLRTEARRRCLIQAE